MPSLSIRQKALNYVLSSKVKPYRFIDAKEDVYNYFVRYEEPLEYGRYHELVFAKNDEKDSREIEQDILKAMNHLSWIAAGNEFPNQTK